MDEREWLRAGLLVNLIKAQCWDETPEAIKKDAPFELT
jgi:hypothetical protein